MIDGSENSEPQCKSILPDGGQHEVGLLVGGQVTLGQGRGTAVWQGLTTTQSIVVMDVDD